MSKSIRRAQGIPPPKKPLLPVERPQPCNLQCKLGWLRPIHLEWKVSWSILASSIDRFNHLTTHLHVSPPFRCYLWSKYGGIWIEVVQLELNLSLFTVICQWYNVCFILLLSKYIVGPEQAHYSHPQIASNNQSWSQKTETSSPSTRT